MRQHTIILSVIAAASIAVIGPAAAQDAHSQTRSNGFKIDSDSYKTELLGRGSPPNKTVVKTTLQAWMSPEVADAWNQGYTGGAVNISVIDDFNSTTLLSGNLGDGIQQLHHGEWTLKEASMIAPSAKLQAHEFTSGRGVALSRGLNVLNLSYASYGNAGYSAEQIGWRSQEASIIYYAKSGEALVSKAAGNDAIPVGAATAGGYVDYLNLALKGAPAAILVGALSRNGTTATPASMASYSNTAGTDPVVQNQFLTVGVEGSKTGLYGTSFAAPVITGYAAILGSKFKTASATQIANQLLSTARQDTLVNYSAEVYGRGEASLTRALAPARIR